MDDNQFDNLTRRLARGASRRTVIGGLIGGLAGGLLGLRRAETAAKHAQLDLDLGDLLVCVGLSPLLATRLCISLGLPHVTDAACEGGRCVIKGCEPGWADCDGDAANGCETPLGTGENCATCGDACAGGQCQNGTCLLPNGEPCTDGAQCISGFCVDGVCCDTICAGQCEACNLPDQVGACSPVTGAPVGGRPVCPGDGACQGACDGQTREGCAAFPGAETPCGAATCADGILTTLACGDDGSCAPTTTSCAPFDCNAEGTACLTSCSDSADVCGGECCGEDEFCSGDQCAACLGRFEFCAADNQCCTGFCEPYGPGGTGANCRSRSDVTCEPSMPNHCFPGQVCCPTEVEGMPGRCTHLDSPVHCGTSCDNAKACSAGQSCVDGQCVNP